MNGQGSKTWVAIIDPTARVARKPTQQTKLRIEKLTGDLNASNARLVVLKLYCRANVAVSSILPTDAEEVDPENRLKDHVKTVSA